VGDLEHVCPGKRYASVTRARYIDGALCSVALQQPTPLASATGSCQQQHLHSGAAGQQLLPRDLHRTATISSSKCACYL
jgi:hypothetical protein